jgi:hypothetical protein
MTLGPNLTADELGNGCGPINAGSAKKNRIEKIPYT